MAAEILKLQVESHKRLVFSQWEQILRQTQGIEDQEEKDAQQLAMTRSADQKNKFGPKVNMLLSFEMAQAYYPHPTIVWTIQKAKNEFIKTQEGQRADARQEMRRYCNLDFAMSKNVPLFPDIPMIHPSLSHLSFYTNRRNVALNPKSAHPRYGVPDDFQTNQSGTYRQSRDVHLFWQLYRLNKAFQDARGERDEIKEIVNLFEQTAQSEIPVMEDKYKDLLRFLGLGKETTSEKQKEALFIEKMGTDLYNRIINKMITTKDDHNQFLTAHSPAAGEAILSLLSDYATFAFNSGNLRPKVNQKRKSGESYYCHYLTASWMLWNLYEDDITSEKDLWELVEDALIMFIHDLPEDLKENLIIEEDKRSNGTNWILQLKGTAFRLKINRAQKIILDTLTKKTDEGEGWFNNILNIEDDLFPELNDKLRLLKRVSRCKSADRLSNLPTMTAVGGPYIEAVRKLNESVESGAPLLWYGHLAGKGPLETMVYLSKLNHTSFLQKFAIIPLLADMEKKVVLSKFGRQFFQNILESGFDWANNLIQILAKEYDTNHPYWLRRYLELRAYYNIPDFYFFLPEEYLDQYFGLKHFAQTTLESGNSLSHLGLFDNELTDLSAFKQFATPLCGPIIGGLENIWGSAYVQLAEIPDLFYVSAIGRIENRNITITVSNLNLVKQNS